MSLIVGKELREAREKKELSLNEVSEELHIRLTYLQAIENGRTEILPSAVQGRGFVRMYADFLGLNVNEILNSWDSPQAPAAPVQAAVPPVKPIETTQPRKVSPVSEPTQFQPQSFQSSTIHSRIDQAQTNRTIPQPAVRSFQSASQPVSQSIHQHGFQQEQPAETQPIVPQDPIRDTFHSIGAELKQRREALCFSFEDCESQTLIRSNYIESMENGDFDQLPSYIQGRGMLNNYASFLNLNVDSIMLRFADALQLLSQENARNALTASSKSPDKPHKPVKKVGKLRQFLTPDLFIGVVVILGMAGIIIYSAITITEYKALPPTMTVDFSSGQLVQNLEETALIQNVEPTATATVDPNTLLQNSLANMDDQTTEEEVVSNRPVQVFITSDQRTYLRVMTDGQEAFSGRTLPNNTYPFYADNLIEVTTGNAGALSVVYNQQSLGKLGDIGQVLSIGFYPEMAATPTPRFSPTPTNTYEPTYTPQPATAYPTLTATPYIP